MILSSALLPKESHGLFMFESWSAALRLMDVFQGCYEKVEEWLDDNKHLLGTIAMCVLVIQVSVLSCGAQAEGLLQQKFISTSCVCLLSSSGWPSPWLFTSRSTGQERSSKPEDESSDTVIVTVSPIRTAYSVTFSPFFFFFFIIVKPNQLLLLKLQPFYPTSIKQLVVVW